MATEQYQDYFSPKDVRYTYIFPDKRSSITFRKLTEGDRAFLQNSKSKIEYKRTSDTMLIDSSSFGMTKIETIQRAAIEWDIQRVNAKSEMERVPFEANNLELLLKGLDPTIVDAMYEKVTENNPWITQVKQDKEELKKQIALLNQQLVEAETAEKK